MNRTSGNILQQNTPAIGTPASLGLWLAAALVTALALALRLHNLDYESLFMDELRQVSTYGYPLGEIANLAAGAQQPPLDYWIGHFVFKLAQSDFAARLPAALFGAGAVALLLVVTARYTRPGVAVLGGIIMSMLPFHIYYSQDARPYSIAIFFLLLLIATLQHTLNTATARRGGLGAVLVAAVLFLHTRTLSPLVVVCSLGFASFVCFTWLRLREGSFKSTQQKRLLGVVIVLGIAALLYYPALAKVLEAGNRYAPDAARMDLALLGQGIKRFTLVPMAQAFVAQLEPVGWFLGPFLLLSPFAIHRRHQQWVLPRILLLGLVVAVLLHSFIFHAKTTAPLRVPYVVYLAPLVLLLCAISLDWLLDQVQRRWDARRARFAFAALASLAVVATLPATLDFKSLRTKTDWRGLSHYLASEHGSEQLVVFDSLVKLGGWSPTFYGFPRYYRGASALVDLREIPALVEQLAALEREPVLVIFRYRDYFLTRRSRYSIHPGAEHSHSLDFAAIAGHPDVRSTEFTGLLVVRLAEQETTLVASLIKLLGIVTSVLPENEILVDLLQARAALLAACGRREYADDLARATRHAPASHTQQIDRLNQSIEQRATSTPALPDERCALPASTSQQ